MRLQRLVVDAREPVRTDALERLVDVAPNRSAAAARGGLDDPSLRRARSGHPGARHGRGSPRISPGSLRDRATRRPEVTCGGRVRAESPRRRRGLERRLGTEHRRDSPVPSIAQRSHGRRAHASRSRDRRLDRSGRASCTRSRIPTPMSSTPRSRRSDGRTTDADPRGRRRTSTTGGPPARQSTRWSESATTRSSSSTTASGATSTVVARRSCSYVQPEESAHRRRSRCCTGTSTIAIVMSGSQSCEALDALGSSDAGGYADDSAALDDGPDPTVSVVRDDLEHATLCATGARRVRRRRLRQGPRAERSATNSS